jgi:hypothetical protein
LLLDDRPTMECFDRDSLPLPHEGFNMLWNWKFKLSRHPGSISIEARRLVARYLIAAALGASLLFAGQSFLQQSLEQQEQTRKIVGLASRQRILSQRIAKSALLIQAAPPGPHRQHLAIELRQLLDLWSRYQMGLAQGDEALALPAEQSHAIDSMYSDLHSVYVAIDSAGKQLISVGRGGPHDAADERTLNKAAADMQKFERRFLEGMDRIVHQHESESRAQLAQLRWTGRALVVLALAALPLAGWWLVWPAARRLQSDVEELDDLRRQLLTIRTFAELARREPAVRAGSWEMAGRSAPESSPAAGSEPAPIDAPALVIAMQAAVERDDQAALGRLLPRLLANLATSGMSKQVTAAAFEVQQAVVGRDLARIAQALNHLQRRLKQPAAGLPRETRPTAAVA